MHFYLSMAQGFQPSNCSCTPAGVCGASIFSVHLFRPPTPLSTLGSSLWCHWEHWTSLPYHLLSWSGCQGKHNHKNIHPLLFGWTGVSIWIKPRYFQTLINEFESLCHSYLFYLLLSELLDWLGGIPKEQMADLLHSGHISICHWLGFVCQHGVWWGKSQCCA